MLKICLVFWESEPLYAYKRYAYKKTCIVSVFSLFMHPRAKLDRSNKVVQSLNLPSGFKSCQNFQRLYNRILGARILSYPWYQVNDDRKISQRHYDFTSGFYQS